MSHNGVAAVVLAAGLSQRMGRLKPLLPFGDRPMLSRVLESLLAVVEASRCIVVTGHAAPEIRAAVADSGVTFAHNSDYASGGMLSSVQSGVRALPTDTKAFFLVLGDQPMVAPETVGSLLRAWRAAPASAIVLPLYGDRRGHPVLFASRCAAEIMTLPPDATLKTCVQRHAADTVQVAVDDPAVIADVDTPDDYQQALNLWQTRALAARGAEPRSP